MILLLFGMLLDWQHNLPKENVTHYIVYCAPTVNGPWKLHSSTELNLMPIINRQPSEYFIVTAVDYMGNESTNKPVIK